MVLTKVLSWLGIKWLKSRHYTQSEGPSLFSLIVGSLSNLKNLEDWGLLLFSPCLTAFWLPRLHYCQLSQVLLCIKKNEAFPSGPGAWWRGLSGSWAGHRLPSPPPLTWEVLTLPSLQRTLKPDNDTGKSAKILLLLIFQVLELSYMHNVTEADCPLPAATTLSACPALTGLRRCGCQPASRELRGS